MRILILNWRDFKDPKAGGAEHLTHEIAKRLVIAGNEVVQHNSIYKGASKVGFSDGVKFVRHGNFITTYIYSFLTILLKRVQFDLVIDEVHGIPYFTPLITKKKIVVLALEVARKHWFLVYPFPVNILGKILEKAYIFIYRVRRIKFLTISPSTKKALELEGINSTDLTIIPMGVSSEVLKILPTKESLPTVVFLGRLSPIKGVEDAVKAYFLIRKKIPFSQFWIIGDGNKKYVNKIHYLVEKLGLKDKTTFFGFVEQKIKFELLSRAHVLIVPSKNEGWGLVVPEAGLVKTPSVVYDVEGLRDIVEDEISGIKVDENTPEDLAKKTIELLNNKKLYGQIVREVHKKAKKMSWDETAKKVLEILNK